MRTVVVADGGAPVMLILAGRPRAIPGPAVEATMLLKRFTAVWSHASPSFSSCFSLLLLFSFS